MAWDMPPSPTSVVSARSPAAILPRSACRPAPPPWRPIGRAPGSIRAASAGLSRLYFFRLAAILQGIAGRVRDGTAASQNAAGMAGMVRPLAAKAWTFAREAGAG